MKFLMMLVLATLPFLAFSQEESEIQPIEETSATVGNESIDPEKAKDMMEKLQKGQKMREDQSKFLEELETEE